MTFMKRPVTLLIAAILVALLVLISAVWPMVSGQKLLGGTRFANEPQPAQGNVPTGEPPGGTPPTQPGNGNNRQPMNSNSSTGPMNNGASTTNPGKPGAGMNGGLADGSIKNRILEYVLYSVILILGLVAFGGLWISRRWGIVVSIITAALVFVETLPGLFRSISTINLVVSLIKVVLAIGIIILVVLPVSQPVHSQTQ
jgi:hypothetical protein